MNIRIFLSKNNAFRGKSAKLLYSFPYVPLNKKNILKRIGALKKIILGVIAFPLYPQLSVRLHLRDDSNWRLLRRASHPCRSQEGKKGESYSKKASRRAFFCPRLKNKN